MTRTAIDAALPLIRAELPAGYSARIGVGSCKGAIIVKAPVYHDRKTWARVATTLMAKFPAVNFGYSLPAPATCTAWLSE